MIVFEILVALLLVIGALFILVGSLGLAKLPDMMRRLHAPTKATTLGIGAMLVASMIFFFFVQGTLSLHELLITLFLFITAPVSGYMIAKAHILRDRSTRETLPPPGDSRGWSTLEAPTTTRKRTPAP
jgi:multicomponent K+:H+ antiporter subunit G